jgi:hypothetical protein
MKISISNVVIRVLLLLTMSMGALFTSQTVLAGSPWERERPTPKQDHTCQGGHNCNSGGGSHEGGSGGDGGNGGHGGAGGNGGYGGEGGYGGNAGDSSATSTSSGGAGGTANADGGAGGSVDNVNHGSTAHGGQSTNSNDSNNEGVDSYSQAEQLVDVQIQYDATAAGAADLFLAECTDGSSGQIEEGGFAIAQVNFICEAETETNLRLRLIAAELQMAHQKSSANPSAHHDTKECFTDRGGNERCSTTVQEHIDHAHNLLMAIHERIGLDGDTDDYMDARSVTAPVGAVFRDTWPLWALLLLAIL